MKALTVDQIFGLIQWKRIRKLMEANEGREAEIWREIKNHDARNPDHAINVYEVSREQAEKAKAFWLPLLLYLIGQCIPESRENCWVSKSLRRYLNDKAGKVVVDTVETIPTIIRVKYLDGTQDWWEPSEVAKDLIKLNDNGKSILVQKSAGIPLIDNPKIWINRVRPSNTIHGQARNNALNRIMAKLGLNPVVAVKRDKNGKSTRGRKKGKRNNVRTRTHEIEVSVPQAVLRTVIDPHLAPQYVARGHKRIKATA